MTPLQLKSLYMSTLTPAAKASLVYTPSSGNCSIKTLPEIIFSSAFALQLDTVTYTLATSQVLVYSAEQTRYSNTSSP